VRKGLAGRSLGAIELAQHRYPIWGVQWHPEKNIYEWGIKDNAPFEEINHSRQAVRVAQWTANFFVDHVC
jgi:hypothetical protein